MELTVEGPSMYGSFVEPVRLEDTTLASGTGVVLREVDFGYLGSVCNPRVVRHSEKFL